MDEQKRLFLKKKFAEISDYELTEFLSAGKEEYEPESYDLLLAEARKRGIEGQAEEIREEMNQEEEAPVEAENNVEAFVELVIVVNDKDKQAIESILNPAGIQYYFQEMNIRGKEWPIALMVEQFRFEDAVESLTKNFNTAGSLILG